MNSKIDYLIFRAKSLKKTSISSLTFWATTAKLGTQNLLTFRKTFCGEKPRLKGDGVGKIR